MRITLLLLIIAGIVNSICKDCEKESTVAQAQTADELNPRLATSDEIIQWVISREADDLTPAVSGATIATSVLDNKRFDIQLTVKVANRLSHTSVTADKFYDFHPVWEPHDKYIVFDSYRGNAVGLWKLPLEQAEPESIIVPKTGMAFGASFSPDGKKIAFVECSNLDLDWWTQYIFPPRMKRPEHFRIMIYDQQTREASFAVFGITPAWSPRGNFIAYSSSDGTSWNIWIYDISKGERYPLVTNSRYDDFYPCWSPDGNWLAFTRFYEDKDATDIWAAAFPDGRPIVQLTSVPNEVEGAPVWTNEGIYFHASRNGQDDFDIALIRNENLPHPVSSMTSQQKKDKEEAVSSTRLSKGEKQTPPYKTAGKSLRIKVLNSTRTPKLAARTAELLESKGFTVSEVGNSTSERNLSKGKIYYKPGLRDFALQIANIIPGVQLLVESNEFKEWDVVVVIGKNTQY